MLTLEKDRQMIEWFVDAGGRLAELLAELPNIVTAAQRGGWSCLMS